MFVGVAKLFCRIARWLTRPFRRTMKPKAALPIIVQPQVAAVDLSGTAVAGYVRRIEVEDRCLASRLKAVAALNVPEGRVPFVARPQPRSIQIPAARLGAKKTRPAHTTSGRRVPPCIVAAKVLAFQVAIDVEVMELQAAA